MAKAKHATGNRQGSSTHEDEVMGAQDTVVGGVVELSTEEARLVVQAESVDAFLTQANQVLPSLDRQSFCDWWRTHQDQITEVIAFLKNGKVKILFLKIALPKVLRGVGEFLALANKFILAACGQG